MSTALVESMETYFGELEDPRRETKNKYHLFMDILVIAVCGAICGANTWTGIAAYGRAKESWFRSFLELPEGIPSHDTFNDVFAKLDAGTFEQCFINWTSSISKLLPGEVVPIDGKTLRRSHDAASNLRPIHIVSAWSTSNALVLGQFKTSEKSNEITAIPMLLEILSVEGCLVTIDAMGCQKKIAETILGKGADYLLAVKDNQPSLYQEIDKLFFESEEKTLERATLSYTADDDNHHGRRVTRRCWVLDVASLTATNRRLWKGLAAIVIIESERTVNGKTSLDHRFYITSSKKTSADYYLQATRNHWHIENKLHWVLDVGFREDESRIRKGDGAENFSILRRIALNLLKKEKTDKTGIETKRLRAGWDNQYLKKVLSGLGA